MSNFYLWTAVLHSAKERRDLPTLNLKTSVRPTLEQYVQTRNRCTSSRHRVVPPYIRVNTNWCLDIYEYKWCLDISEYKLLS